MFTRVILVALLIPLVGCMRPGGQPTTSPSTRPSKDFGSDKGPPEVKGGATDTKPAAKTDAKDDGMSFEIRMADETVMKVVLAEPTLTVSTKYGKLSVPANEVRRLEFGFRFPDGVEEKINKAIADLGSSEFRTREDAEQALASIGNHAIPALRRAAKSDDPEVMRRAKAVLKLVEARVANDKVELRDYDVIETAEFTIKGRLEMNTLKVRTKYFGDTTVKITDVRSFRSVGSASSAEFALDAGKYAKLNQSEWMETAIEVSAGQQLEVTATGRIDQWPQGPGQYMVGPEGQGGGNPGFAPGGVQRVGLSGQVIGRIGPSGAQFGVGGSYKGKPTESGKLYLRIGPSQWNCDSSGSYKVTVNVTTP